MHSSYRITLLRADCLPKHLQGDLILAVGLLDHLHQQRLQRVNLRLRECARPSVALLVGALEHVPRDSWRRECGTQPGCFGSMGVPMSKDVWAEVMRGSPKQLVCMLQLFDRGKSYIRFPLWVDKILHQYCFCYFHYDMHRVEPTPLPLPETYNIGPTREH